MTIKGSISILQNINSKVKVDGLCFNNGECIVSEALVEIDDAINHIKSQEGLLLNPLGLNDQTLYSEVYKANNLLNVDGEIHLIGDTGSVFIFITNDTLRFKENTKIILEGVVPANVFWYSEKAIVLEENTDIRGVLISDANIIDKREGDLAEQELMIYTKEYLSIIKVREVMGFRYYYFSDINLASASQFALLANQIEVYDNVSVAGNVGGNITGDLNIITEDQHKVYMPDSCKYQQDLADIFHAQRLYSKACILNEQIIDSDLSGQNLATGTYMLENIYLNGTLILTGDSSSIYIFYTAGAMTIESNSCLDLGNVLPHNVLWLAVSDIELKQNINFSGIIIGGRKDIILHNNNIGRLAVLQSVDFNKIVIHSNAQSPVYLMAQSVMKAVSLCETAEVITIKENYTPQTFQMTGLQKWFKFTPDTSSVQIKISFPDNLPNAQISGLYLYDGTCKQLNLIAQTNTDELATNDLIPGNSYYLIIESAELNEFDFSVCIYCKAHWGIGARVLYILSDEDAGYDAYSCSGFTGDSFIRTIDNNYCAPREIKFSAGGSFPSNHVVRWHFFGGNCDVSSPYYSNDVNQIFSCKYGYAELYDVYADVGTLDEDGEYTRNQNIGFRAFKIYIHGIPPPPSFELSPQSPICPGTDVVRINNINTWVSGATFGFEVDDPLTGYYWHGNYNINTSCAPVGVYEVRAYSENVCGTSDTIINFIEISFGADIEYESTICFGKETEFQVTHNCNYYYVDNGDFFEDYTYLWNFGDNNTSTQPVSTHTYSSPGTYNVSLSIVDSDNCNSTCSSQRIQVAPNCCVYDVNYNHTNYTVSGNVNWHNMGIIRIKDLLKIKAGASLSIQNTTVEFGPFGKIIVEHGNPSTQTQGANLTLTGGSAVLTSVSNPYKLAPPPPPSCQIMWQGIEVWGNGNIPHYPSDNQKWHGRLIINSGAKIKNAHNAVLLGRFNDEIYDPCSPTSIRRTPYVLQNSGGIIFADGGSFTNNAISVRFAPFNPVGKNKNNASYIHGCQFTGGGLLDPGYRTSNTYTYPNSGNWYFADHNLQGRSATGIRVLNVRWGNKFSAFQHNIFTNMEEGIKTTGAKYWAHSNEFTNLTYGIRNFNYNSSVFWGNVISKNRFNKISKYMLEMQGCKYDLIHNENQFGDAFFVTPQSSNNTGILLLNTSYFDIRDNDFHRLPYGIVCINSGAGGGNIRAFTRIIDETGNRFRRCSLDILTLKNNSHLQIKCNTSDNQILADYGSTNWLNTGLNSRLAHQGQFSSTDTKMPAGNLFKPHDKKQIVNDAFTSICWWQQWGWNWVWVCWDFPLFYVYNAHSTPMQRRPTITPADYINLNTNSASYKDGVSCEPLCISPPYVHKARIEEIKQKIMQLKEEYNTVEANLDKGQTQNLITAINKNQPTPPGQLKNILLSASPLSDTVLISFINRTVAVTPPGIFKEALIPDSPVSNEVRYHLNNKLPSLPQGIRNELLAAQASVFYRTLTAISREIEGLETEHQLLFNDIIRNKLKNDSIEEVIALLEQENNNPSQQILFATYLGDNDIVSASAKLNSFVPATEEESDWKELAGLLLSLATADKTVYEINEEQEQFIRMLAEKEERSLAVTQAQAILRLIYGEEFPFYISDFKNAKTEEPPVVETSATTKISRLFPNPLSDYTVLYYQLEEEQKGKLEIYTALGQKIAEYDLLPQHNKLVIKTENLKSGLYFYTISAEGALIETDKMIIIK